MARIVCVGLACLDYLFKVETLPGGGTKCFAEDYRAAPGGPAAVAGIAAARLGHEAFFIGRLGADPVGDEVVRLLGEAGVDATRTRRLTGRASQVSAVVIDAVGERQIVNYSSRELDPDPAWISAAMISTADFLLTDVRWPEGARRAMQLAAAHGVPSLLDADISPVEVSDLVDLATYAIFSERGLQLMSGADTIVAGLKTVEARGRSWPAVTAGEQGSYWLEDGAVRHCPAQRITPVDTCGAGDVFHGAFAAAIVEGRPIAAAMRFAGAAAALKCASFGGGLGAPGRAAVEGVLAAGG